MNSFRWQDLIRPSRQQITAIVLFVAIIAALLPIPLASSGAKNDKDLSRPFPCQDRPCGCRSAEQCKKKCCCFSPAQKLSWAKRNKATSFDHGVVELKRESLDNHARLCSKEMQSPHPEPLSPQSRGDGTPSTIAHGHLDSSSSQGCCSSKRGTKSSVEPMADTDQSRKMAYGTETRRKVVVGVFAQECRGVDQTLSGQSLFVVPAAFRPQNVHRFERQSTHCPQSAFRESVFGATGCASARVEHVIEQDDRPE